MKTCTRILSYRLAKFPSSESLYLIYQKLWRRWISTHKGGHHHITTSLITNFFFIKSELKKPTIVKSNILDIPVENIVFCV
jgi:hypothetical protein